MSAQLPLSLFSHLAPLGLRLTTVITMSQQTFAELYPPACSGLGESQPPGAANLRGVSLQGPLSAEVQAGSGQDSWACRNSLISTVEFLH